MEREWFKHLSKCSLPVRPNFTMNFNSWLVFWAPILWTCRLTFMEIMLSRRFWPRSEPQKCQLTKTCPDQKRLNSTHNSSLKLALKIARSSVNKNMVAVWCNAALKKVENRKSYPLLTKLLLQLVIFLKTLMETILFRTFWSLSLQTWTRKFSSLSGKISSDWVN